MCVIKQYNVRTTHLRMILQRIRKSWILLGKQHTLIPSYKLLFWFYVVLCMSYTSIITLDWPQLLCETFADRCTTVVCNATLFKRRRSSTWTNLFLKKFDFLINLEVYGKSLVNAASRKWLNIIYHRVIGSSNSVYIGICGTESRCGMYILYYDVQRSWIMNDNSDCVIFINIRHRSSSARIYQ